MDKQKFNSDYYKSIFDNIDFSIAEHEMIYDDNGKCIDYKHLYVNKVFCDAVNIPLEGIIGKSALKLFPETEQYWIDEFGKVVETGNPSSLIRYSTEFDKYYSVYSYKSGDKSFVSCFTDVTKIVEEYKKENIIAPKYRVSNGHTKIGFFEVNRLSNKVDVSNSFCKVIGQESISERFFREEIVNLTQEDDKAMIKDLLKMVLNGNLREHETEFQMFNDRENAFHWMSVSVFAIESDENDVPFRYTGIIRDIKNEKDRLEELKETEYLFREARKVANLTTFIYNNDTNKFDYSKELDEFTGVKNLREIEQYRKIVHPEDLKIYDDATDYSLSHAEGKVAIYRIIKDEIIKFVQSSVYTMTDKFGNTEKIFGILKDITEIERSRRNAMSARKSFELIFNSSPAGIFLLNKDFEISMENKTFREMFDSKETEINLKYLLGDLHDNTIKDLKNNVFNRVVVEHNIKNENKHMAINITRIDEEFVNDYQGTVVDITERYLDREKIGYLATHDTLTGLFNRNYFEEVIANQQLDYPLGIIMCDIDGLKLVNDAFGHMEGDKLLSSFSKELNKLFPKYIVSRIGGDEFTILVINATEDQLDDFSEKIKESIQNIDNFQIDFGVSVGYSILEDKDSDFKRIFNQAENMMYRRKLTERRSRKSNSLLTIMQTLHEKTEETLIHCQRVGDYSSMMLADYGYKRVVDLDDIRFLSDVHDIGKIATPEGILNKKTKLTKSEYEEIKYHSEAGYKIIQNIVDKDEIAYGVLYHHERYDGFGYPHGLKGENIPLYARILAIADSYDTMIRGRIYQKPISKREALKDIKKNSGTQFDPEIAESFIRLMENENE